MRFIRLAALVGSLVLLVATAVSVVHRRGDLRDNQVARVEQSSLLLAQSVRTNISRARQDVHLAAIAAAGPTPDDRALAEELVRFFPEAEACVADASGCTGTDLFSLDDVNDLAALSLDAGNVIEGEVARAQIGVDEASESLLVVRRLSGDQGEGVVAMRIPVADLVSEATQSWIDDVDVSSAVVTRARGSEDVVNEPEVDGNRRSIDETVGSPFAFGSLDLSVESTRSVGIAGEATARYATLLVLGTVLLLLAGWTVLLEGRQLEKRASTDELTGLVNRREFERISEEAIDMADRFNTGLCVMVIDLNGFKQVNDTLGHQFGDLVLAASAERLVEAVRDTDVVGRWGGDEFVILLPGLAERTAVRNSAERIWHRLSGTPVVGDTTMTASIGASIFPRHGTTLDALMRTADVAMYEAKSTGVSHRIADTIEATEALLAEQHHPGGGAGGGEPPLVEAPPPIVSDDYVGADRRRSPVPPPPMPPAALLPPPDSTRTPASTTSES